MIYIEYIAQKSGQGQFGCPEKGVTAQASVRRSAINAVPGL